MNKQFPVPSGHPSQTATKRKSHMNYGEIYFWTATINGWNHLLKQDNFKDIIINSWTYLGERQLIDLFAFVIMPNHVHSIWRVNGPNGRETPQASFLKYTAHQFQKKIREEHPAKEAAYSVNASNKNYNFWKPDSLAFPLHSRNKALQKLNYIHTNPLQKHWQLVKHPCDYKYSSAKFYEQNIAEFDILKNLWVEF